ACYGATHGLPPAGNGAPGSPGPTITSSERTAAMLARPLCASHRALPCALLLAALLLTACGSGGRGSPPPTPPPRPSTSPPPPPPQPQNANLQGLYVGVYSSSRSGGGGALAIKFGPGTTGFSGPADLSDSPCYTTTTAKVTVSGFAFSGTVENTGTSPVTLLG